MAQLDTFDCRYTDKNKCTDMNLLLTHFSHFCVAL